MFASRWLPDAASGRLAKPKAKTKARNKIEAETKIEAKSKTWLRLSLMLGLRQRLNPSWNTCLGSSHQDHSWPFWHRHLERKSLTGALLLPPVSPMSVSTLQNSFHSQLFGTPSLILEHLWARLEKSYWLRLFCYRTPGTFKFDWSDCWQVYSDE